MERNPDCQIIPIVNQKGGVGKTTTAVNIATAFAALGKKTLLIDFDPQGNASTGLGIATIDRKPNAYDVILGRADIASSEKESKIPNLTVVPAVVDLAAIDIELANKDDREFLLRDQINDCDNYYDYVIIDCPPSLGMLTVNSLAAGTSIIVPLQCEFFALEGLAHLLETVELVQNNLNPGLELNGVVLTMFDRRNKLTEQVADEVREYLREKVFETIIPRNVRLSEAPSHGKPAIIYDYKCPGSQAYLHLVREILKREENKKNQEEVENV